MFNSPSEAPRLRPSSQRLHVLEQSTRRAGLTRNLEGYGNARTSSRARCRTRCRPLRIPSSICRGDVDRCRLPQQARRFSFVVRQTHGIRHRRRRRAHCRLIAANGHADQCRGGCSSKHSRDRLNKRIRTSSIAFMRRSTRDDRPNRSAGDARCRRFAIPSAGFVSHLRHDRGPDACDAWQPLSIPAETAVS